MTAQHHRVLAAVIILQIAVLIVAHSLRKMRQGRLEFERWRTHIREQYDTAQWSAGSEGGSRADHGR